jgi:NAD+ synthase
MDQNTVEKLVRWIRYKVTNAHAKGCLVGMSGGVDSSVTAALCVRACPGAAWGIHVICRTLPRDTEDAILAAETLGIPLIQVDITEAFRSMADSLQEGGLDAMDRMAAGNLRARLMMAVLYHHAREKGALVVGTTNRSEMAVGYFTKYGDGGADLLPLGGIVKTDIWEMASLLGVPGRIIRKQPSAGFWPGQTDEEDMGFTYRQLDRVLLNQEQDIHIQAMVDRMAILNDHKKKRPPIPRIQI